MAVYRRPARSRFTLLLLVLTSITLLTLDYRGAGSGAIDATKNAARDVLAPLQNTSDKVLAPVGNFLGGVLHYGSLKSENQRLRDQNADLRGQVLRADDAERERRALRDQLNLSYINDVPRVDAEVVSTNPSNFELSITINRGSSQGVVKGMPVVTGAGLVGRIASASRNRSIVQLVVDDKFSVGIRVDPQGDVGVATGHGLHRAMSVGLLEQQNKFDKGQVVVTSGLQESQFPPGIPVGRISKAAAHQNQLDQDVEIEPVADLGRVAFVTVLQWSPK
jgi:rod shape-determining protein MreC